MSNTRRRTNVDQRIRGDRQLSTISPSPSERRASRSHFHFHFVLLIPIVLIILILYFTKDDAKKASKKLRADKSSAPFTSAPILRHEISLDESVKTLVACGITADRLNDDFCDCPNDGSDEYLTSACSPVGSIICGDRRVPSSKINDGVKDCCDGSDERLFVGTIRGPYGC